MKNWQKYQQLTLAGRSYDKAQLLGDAFFFQEKENVPDWQKSLWQFIGEWLSGSDEIQVKTSGSTGKPKIISLEKDKMVNSALATGNFFELKHNDTALLCLPCDYIAGKMMVVRAFVLGLDLYAVEPSGNPLGNIDTAFAFAAMIPLQVAKSISENRRKMNRISQLIVGGAAVDTVLDKELQTLETICFATYGMTETITHIALRQLNKNPSEKYRTLTNVRISKDERNCLLINAPHLSDEFIITNDVVKIHSENEFELLGRFDNVINSGGMKIHPEQIEKSLETILDCRFFISSISDNLLGERVVLVTEKIVSPSELKQIKQTLDKYHFPKEFFYIPSFIETETGKVKRKDTLLKAIEYSKENHT